MAQYGDVAIVYPYIPHYRVPVFKMLINKNLNRTYKYYAGVNGIDKSIKSQTLAEDFDFNMIPTFTFKGLTFQSELFKVCVGSKFDHIIFLADPHFVTTWVYAALARVFGKKVWFWTHGWLRPERGLKGCIRRIFYALPHGLLLYGERAKEIGLKSGFDQRRLHVIFNSLDYSSQRNVRLRLSKYSGNFPSSITYPDWLNGVDYFACVARLTNACRFDLAIEALALLREEHGVVAGMVLIGEGPQRGSLEKLAAIRGVNCWFVGALYDEEAIGPLIYNARAVVSPGKVGLTAMHALAYGTPVISHDNFDLQMPEFEAISPGLTGDFFAEDSAPALANVLLRWLRKPRNSDERKACYTRIEECYTPERQSELIEAALSTQD